MFKPLRALRYNVVNIDNIYIFNIYNFNIKYILNPSPSFFFNN